MAIGERDDPVVGYNFTISLLDSSSSLAKSFTTVSLKSVIDTPVGGFNECTGLDVTLDLHEQEEGGRNGSILRFPTRAKPGRIILKKGMTKGTELWDWINGFIIGDYKRKDGIITLLDESRRPHTVWGFIRGMPAKYSAPQLNAQQSNVAFESVEIEHEGLEFMSGGSELGNAIKSAAEGVSSLF